MIQLSLSARESEDTYYPDDSGEELCFSEQILNRIETGPRAASELRREIEKYDANLDTKINRIL